MKILTDDIEIEPTYDFNRYAETIVNIVLDSHPRFSIGIYGKSGTGKTNLTDLIYQRLMNGSNASLQSVRFNAWRYERASQFIGISLMKTIAYALADELKYREIKSLLLRSLSSNRNYMKDIGLVQAGTERDAEAEADRDTIYYEGLDNIQREMKLIIKEEPKSRVVVFIDDLDRCSPATIMQAFESVKVFLEIVGFIYIIALNEQVLSSKIGSEYGDKMTKRYIRDLIQVPIELPLQDHRDSYYLISNLAKKLDDSYSELLIENARLIADTIEPNPTEIKRFINRFVVSSDLYRQVERHDLLVAQILNVGWSNFYQFFSSSDDFRKLVKKYIEMPEEQRNDVLQNMQDRFYLPQEHEKIILDHRLDSKLWNFLYKAEDVLFSIEDWPAINRTLYTNSG